MAAPRSRIRRACAAMPLVRSISPICATPMATSSARCTAFPPEPMPLETLSADKSHGGIQGVYRHDSRETGTPMTFSVFLPPDADAIGRLPVVWYLSGLTCNHANVTEKG